MALLLFIKLTHYPQTKLRADERDQMTNPRTSGILLHPTSLPGPFGIGDLGPEAYAFADFLISSGQTLWQVLPLGPTGYGNSPYSSDSAFAGNTLLISPRQLVGEGLLQRADLENIPVFPEERIDFGPVREFKNDLLHKAFESFKQKGDSLLREAFAEFRERNQFWLDDYALFLAVKKTQGGAGWADWETDLARRKPAALARTRDQLRDDIEAQKFYQFLFFRQWFALKKYCNQRRMKLIGDLPIFVAHDSADVWTAPEQFKLDGDRLPIVVAGVPPDYFGETGQFWGNPLYDWEQMRADGFQWWVRRIRSLLSIHDFLRMDHFRGFVACWEIPGNDRTAERGRWVEAPGEELFRTLKKELGQLPIIAEDLGVITPEVDALRDAFGFPGMRVLQFGFSGGLENIHLPHNYPKNTVAYTGTHDNDTAVGWFDSQMSDKLQFVEKRTAENATSEIEFCLEYLHSDGTEIHWAFINAVLGSAANTALVPLQDVLGLGTEARMNLPNTVAGNWSWRYRKQDLTELLARRLRGLSTLHGRG